MDANEAVFIQGLSRTLVGQTHPHILLPGSLKLIITLTYTYSVTDMVISFITFFFLISFEISNNWIWKGKVSSVNFTT